MSCTWLTVQMCLTVQKWLTMQAWLTVHTATTSRYLNVRITHEKWKRIQSDPSFLLALEPCSLSKNSKPPTGLASSKRQWTFYHKTVSLV